MDAEELQPRLPQQSDLAENPGVRQNAHRRKSRVSGVRLRRDSGPIFAKWGTRPETPLLSWKYDEGNGRTEEEKPSGEFNRKMGRRIRVVVSARKLAAGLWRLRSPEGESQKLGHQPVGDHFGANAHCHHVDRVHISSAKDMLVNGADFVSDPKHGTHYKFEPALKLPNPAMEGATKWEPNGWKESDEIKQLFGQSKSRENNTKMISALEADLEQARARINQLEAERRSSKKKLEQFLQKLSEERAAWRSREHEKIRAIIDDLKAELSREKKSRHRLEIANSKLVDELADSKSIAKRYMQEYQKERKARELVEEVCDELAKEIGEDEAEVEAIKRESMKLREEVEDERRMLQMAEVWREERVQMKLVDAKVMLEEKYAQMNQIIEDVESLMKLGGTSDLAPIEKADALRRAAASVNMQDVRELKYEPPSSDDIFSVFEDVNTGESNRRDVDGCSPASHVSGIHTINLDVAMVNKDGGFRNPDGYIESSEVEEDASEWETVSHPDDQGSCFSPDGSDRSTSKRYLVNNGSRAKTQWEKNHREENLIPDIRHVESKVRHLMKLPFAKNGKLPNGTLSNAAIMSPDNASANSGSPQALSGQWNPADPRNAHITRATKGCMEWSRNAQKNSLKARLLEARVESQKVQLRQVLKQEI